MMKEVGILLEIDVMKHSLKRDLLFEAQSEDCEKMAATSNLERPRTTRHSEDDPLKRSHSCSATHTL
jgi:hypothetical protein